MMSKLGKKTRRMISFVLTMVMIITNVVTTVYGAEKKPVADAYYVLDAGDLYEAIADALESGDVFEFDSLGADEEQSSLGEYRRLLGADSGTVYELTVPADDLLMTADADMKVLYDENENKVILLFINQGAETLKFRAQIGDYVTGVVKIKSAWPEGEEVGGGPAAGGPFVLETDVDGNLIGESVSETDADGNPIGEAVTQPDADGNLITEATSETAADGGSTEETAADAGTQKNEETNAGETQGLNSPSTTPATEFWIDSEQTTTAANEPTTEAAVSGTDAETNGGSGMDTETTGNSGMDTETIGSSDMDTETTGNSGMDSETNSGSDTNSETSGAAESGDGAEIRQSEPVEVVEILNDLIPLSATIASEPSEAATDSEQPTAAPTTAQPTAAPTTAQPTEAPTTVQVPEESTTAQPTEAPTTAGDPTEGTTSAIENNDGGNGGNGDNGDGGAGAGGSWWLGGGPRSEGSGLGGSLEDDLEDEEDDLSTYLSDEYMEEYQRLLFGSSSGTDALSSLLSIDYGVANARAISIPADRLGLSEVAPRSLFDLDSQDITELLTGVKITDATGTIIDPEKGKLVVGDTYKINLQFSEQEVQGLQFKSGTLIYQIPAGFKIEAKESQPLWVKINDEQIEIGEYEVDENGQLLITLSEAGIEAINGSYNVKLNFELEGTLLASALGDDGMFNFGGAGQNFTFQVVDQPCVSVEKDGVYTQNENAPGGKLAYTVKTTVEHGELDGAVVSDVLTPPNTSALKLEMIETEPGVPDVTVKVKRAGGEEITLESADYELVREPVDSEHPGKLAFQVKLKGDYENLYLGDELYVTYNYDVQYVEGSTEVFWGNVVNEVTVTGTMLVEDPANPDTTRTVPVEEKRGSNVEVWATPPGNGVIFKTQAYSEATHTLHYTLYTMVPAGEYSPLYIQDDMIVEYNNNRWYIPEFKEEEEYGRVQNLKVSAVDVAAAPEGGWENLSDPERIRNLESYKSEAEKLTGYSFQDLKLDG